MASLDDIVNVQIRLNTSYVSTADFGTILIGGVMPVGKTVESYKSYDEAVADGIEDADTLACIRAAFSQDPKPVRVKVAAIIGQSDTEMTRILKLDDAWYAFVPATEDKNTIIGLAAIIETMKKIMIVSGHSYSDFTSLNDALKAKRYLRTAAIMAGTKFASAAWAAKCLSYSAGQESWALKKLSAVEPAKLTGQQRKYIVDDSNGSTLEWYSNDVAVTAGGKTAGGEWIDTVRGRDWLENYIQTEITALMINTDGKIPYTDRGIALLYSRLQSCLNEGVYRGLIAEDTENNAGDVIKGYGIDVRWANEISANTKASRVYDGLSFWAKLSGAIHVVKITGSFVN